MESTTSTNLWHNGTIVTTVSMILYGVYDFYQSMAQWHYSNYSVYGLLWLTTTLQHFT